MTSRTHSKADRLAEGDRTAASSVALKMAVVIVFLALMGIALLSMRQERFDRMHAMSGHHGGIARARQDLWDMQSRIASRVGPRSLHEVIEWSQIELEPVTPLTGQMPPAIEGVESADAR